MQGGRIAPRVARLRDDVAAKLRQHHPDGDAAALGRSADTMHDGLAAIERDGDRSVLRVFVAGGEPWRLAVKVLPDLDALWISNPHRTRPGQCEGITARPGVSTMSE
ncbi:MAG: hypothetical protein Kow0013_17050 [Pararhodobacter sp.]